MPSWEEYILVPMFALAGVTLVVGALLSDLLTPGPGPTVLLFVLDTRVLLAALVVALTVAFALYLSALRDEDPSKLVFSGESVDAVVPVYNESDVMQRAVDGLLASAYDQLTITVVTEPDDDATRTRAGRLARQHDQVQHLVNTERQGSKAGALNAAIAQSEADVIALFDSDQRPHPNLIPHAMANLRDADAARVRSIPDPSGGLLESMVYYEYLFLFFLPQKLVRVVFDMEFVGSRSVLIRREVFETVGTFSEGHLTEDMDFTHRCHQADVSIRELLYYPTLEQPAHRFRDWWGQRLRWMTGHVEVGHSQLTRWRNWLDVHAMGSVITLGGTFAAGALLTTTIPKLLLAGVGNPVFVGSELAALLGLGVAIRLVDNRTGETAGVGWGWLLVPVAFSLFGLVILAAIFNYAFGLQRDWYSVVKRS